MIKGYINSARKFIENKQAELNQNRCLQYIAKVNDAVNNLRYDSAWLIVENAKSHIVQYNPTAEQLILIQKALDDIALKAVSELLDKAFDAKLQGRIVNIDLIKTWRDRVNTQLKSSIDNKIDILNQTYRGDKEVAEKRQITENKVNQTENFTSRRKWERFISPVITLEINGKKIPCRDWSIGGFAIDNAADFSNIEQVKFYCKELDCWFSETVKPEVIQGFTVFHTEGFNNNILKMIIELKKRGIDPS